MAQNEDVDSVAEERADIMASLSNPKQEPILRMAQFLNPSFPISEAPLPNLPIHTFTANENSLNKKPVVVKYHGWQNPYPEWSKWVDRMFPIYEARWRQAGILEPIKATYLAIRKDDGIVCGLARKWHPETKSFIFQWGEASITLEDVCVLGGFSITGDSILVSVPPGDDKDLKDKRLLEARKKCNQPPTKKVTYRRWVNLFADKRSGFGDVEHEAFLVFWLSKFVFPKVNDVVGKHVHTMAILLARGTRIALAPAVLASLYVDLGKLKESISRFMLDLNKSGRGRIKSWSLMHLVLAWAWERFPALAPNPNPIQFWNPRLARWHDLKGAEVEDVAGVLDGAGEEFIWRPYCMVVYNSTCNEFYWNNKERVVVKLGRGQEVEPFAMFIRHSELVGLDGCIEQYLPHRVAMQFGMDQDVPGLVPRFNSSDESAWAHYKRPLGENELYVPHRLSESDVTVRYAFWRKQAKLIQPETGTSHAQASQQDEDSDDERTISEIIICKRRKVEGKGKGKGKHQRAIISQLFL